MRELSLAFIREKQKIRPKTIVLSTVLFLCCLTFWFALALGGVPPVGLTVLALVIIITPALIIIFLINGELQRIKTNTKLLENGLVISKVILKKKEIHSDNASDLTAYCLYFSSEERPDADYVYGLWRRVSYGEYKKAIPGSLYYAVYLSQIDKYGTRYVLEDTYWAAEYKLSEQLQNTLIDLTEVDDTLCRYWENRNNHDK